MNWGIRQYWVFQGLRIFTILFTIFDMIFYTTHHHDSTLYFITINFVLVLADSFMIRLYRPYYYMAKLLKLVDRFHEQLEMYKTDRCD